MKTFNSLFVIIVTVLLLVTNVTFGQIVAWQFNGSDGKALTYNATTNNVNVEQSILTRGSGAPASGGSSNSFVGALTISADKAAAIANNAYYEFQIKAKADYYVSLTDLDCSIRIQTYSAKIYQYRYSLDGINFTDIGSPVSATDENNNGVFQSTIDVASYADLKNVASTQTITIRLYAWGGSTPAVGSESLINFGFGKSGTTNVPTLIVGGIVTNSVATVSSNPKISGWEFSAYNTANPAPASINATTSNVNLDVPVLSRGTGLKAASFNFAYASTTSVSATKEIANTNNEYYQLSIPPKAGFKVSLSTLKYVFRTFATGPINYRWAYSVDNGANFTEIGNADAVHIASSPGIEYQIDLSDITALQDVKTTVLLRMNVWGATDAATVFGFGRILSGSSTGAQINAVYIRGRVDSLLSLDPMVITVETADNFQKKNLDNNVSYFTNRAYTAYNVPSNLANYEFLSSDGGVSSDGVTPTGTIIPSQDGDIYVLARTSTGVPGWELVPGTEFFYSTGSATAGISVFKKTVTAGQRIPIPVVDNFQEAKPFAKTINYNVYRSVGSGNWSDNTRWEVSTDNINWSAATSSPNSTASAISIPAGQELIVDAPVSTSIITVNPTAKLTVNTATTFNAETLTLKSDTTGTATFIDNGTSSITTANVQQYLTGGRNWYVSIPVSTAASSALSSASSVVCWEETIGDWVSPASSVLSPMRGYISVNTSSTGTVTFSGTLNNGEKYIDLTHSTGKTKEGFNLVGNPYPSYLNWTSSIATAANALTTIWYRTKAGGAYVFQTYNADGGVGSPLGVTGTIPPMQAFWVKANAGGGRLTFNNTMRSHGTDSNPLKAPGIRSVNQQKLVRIQVSNSVNSDEAVVYFNSNASDSYDSFDSPKMTNNNNAVPEIYTVAGNEELVINGLNDSNTEWVIPLGFRSGEANEFSIQLSELQNFDSNVQILLRDNQENSELDITGENSYNFSSEATNTTTRFSLVLRTKGVVTKLENIDNKSFVVHVRPDKTLYISASDKNNLAGKVSVYNELGQLLEHADLTNSTVSLTKNYHSGIYIVKILVDGTDVFARKIIIK